MSKNYKIENVFLFSFQQFSSTPRGVDSVTSICCDREIPKADSVFDPRQKGLFNQKWLQKKCVTEYQENRSFPPFVHCAGRYKLRTGFPGFWQKPDRIDRIGDIIDVWSV